MVSAIHKSRIMPGALAFVALSFASTPTTLAWTTGGSTTRSQPSQTFQTPGQPAKNFAPWKGPVTKGASSSVQTEERKTEEHVNRQPTIHQNGSPSVSSTKSKFAPWQGPNRSRPQDQSEGESLGRQYVSEVASSPSLSTASETVEAAPRHDQQSASTSTPSSQDNQAANPLGDTVIDEELTGETVGDKYLLAGSSMTSSGKSSIFKAYRKNEENGQPEGDPVIVKLSKNVVALEHEQLTYDTVEDDLFVNNLEYLEPDKSCDDFLQHQGALVLELGDQDVKTYVDEKGALKGNELKEVARKCAECIKNIHENGMVWSDVKTQNFVRQAGGVIKGIDLESVSSAGEKVTDWTPPGGPPELAERFHEGTQKEFELEYNFDIWSLGMTLYELASGKHYFDEMKNDYDKVCEELRATDDISVPDDHPMDPLLKDVIGQCLQVDPDSRPTIEEILEHPYFA